MRDALHTLHPAARRWLIAAALLGVGQQMFVVLRNPLLDALGFSSRTITHVQGAGGAAGLLAGALGLAALSRVRAPRLLALGVAANAAGFAMQSASTDPRAMIVGAALAGLGIQALTMTAAPFLASLAGPRSAVRLFGLQAIAAQTLPSALGPLLAGAIASTGRGARLDPLDASRLGLVVGALFVASALVPTWRLGALSAGAAPADTSRLDARLSAGRARVARVLAPDAVVWFAGGLGVPFLQLFFARTYAMNPRDVGLVYAATAVLGTAGNLASPAVSSRVSARSAVVAAQLALAPIFVTLALVHDARVAVAAFALRHAVSNVGNPVHTAIVHTSVAPHEGAPLAAWRMLVQSVAWAAANFVAGEILTASRGGFAPLLLVVAATHLAGAVATWRMLPAHATRES